MKTKVICILVSSIFFTAQAIACGYHKEESTDLKQFADIDTYYDGTNREHRGWSQYLSKSLVNTKKLVLTYDDGPHPVNTPLLLDTLKKYNVKATFFVVASLAKKYPEITKRIAREGHILASHDWEHINGNSESREVFQNGLSKSILTVKNYSGINESYYRFPYGAYGRGSDYHHFNVIKDVGQSLFGDNCINFVFWDIDTSDWVSNMQPNDIVQTLMSNISENGGPAYKFKKSTVNGRTVYIKDQYQIKNPVKGGVILMHDIHRKTGIATERFLEKIKGTPIEIIPLNQVEEFEYNNVVCDLLKV